MKGLQKVLLLLLTVGGLDTARSGILRGYKSSQPEMPCDVEAGESDFTENLFCLFDYGDEHIQYPSEDENVILVVGRSGAGKSTIAQVMTKECEEMEVICNAEEGSCIIRDPDGYSSNETIISETFLPNRIEGLEIPDGAVFYDCPGFEDTRGAMIDIANAHYMAELANRSRNVKLLMISVYSYFEGSIRDLFTDLLLSMSGFIIDPTIFKGSIAMIANRASNDQNDLQAINRIRTNLNLTYEQLQDKGNWSEEAIAESRLIIDELRQQDADTAKLSIFRNPQPNDVSGTLCNYPNLVTARERAVSLIHEKVDYSSSDRNRFEMFLKPSSVLKLVEVFQELLRRIESVVPHLAQTIVNDFTSRFQDYANGDVQDTEWLTTATAAMAAANYPQSPVGDVLKAEQWFSQIKDILLTFVDSEKHENDVHELVKLGGYMDKLVGLHSSLNNYLNPDPFVVWKQNFESIKDTLGIIATSLLQDRIQTNVYNATSSTCMDASTAVIDLVSGIKGTVDTQLSTLQSYITLTTNFKNAIEAYGTGAGGTMHGLTDLFYTNIKTFDGVPVESVEKILLHQNITKAIENLKPIPLNNVVWHRLPEELRTRLDTERKFLSFLRSLFLDLTATPVQIEDAHQLRYWRALLPVINRNNFQTFWDKFGVHGASLSSIVNQDAEGALEYFSSHPTQFNGLNTVLDYTLDGGVSCPPRDGNNLVFTRNYVTMSHIKSCVDTQSGVDRVIVLAGNTFFIDVDWDASNSTTLQRGAIKVFVIAPMWHTRGGRINLSGAAGAPPSPPKRDGEGGAGGARGNSGTHASDLVAVYREKLGGFPDPYSCGGPGGNGQGGQDGISGDPGSPPSLSQDGSDWIPKSVCVAWSGGDIQVKLYPNSCNSAGDTCDAPDNGVWVAIWGEGSEGGDGGEGGQGGVGGAGGHSVLYDLSSDKFPLVTSYDDGAVGSRGSNGDRGRNGANAGLCAKIDDEYKAGDAEKRCRVKEFGNMNNQCSGLEPETFSLGSSGKSLPQKKSTCDSEEAPEYNINEFKPYAVRFRDTAQQKLNPFAFERVTVFLAHLSTTDFFV